jgi:hypothetical protein
MPRSPNSNLSNSSGKVPVVSEEVTDDVDMLRSQNLSIGDVGPELLNCKRTNSSV